MTDPFVLAGEAAYLLEALGDFTAVARKADGRVTLECYPRGGDGRGVCLVIEGRVESADALVRSALRGLRGEDDADDPESSRPPRGEN